MEQVTRVAHIDDHESADEVRARFGALVVAYFVRAIDSLNHVPQGSALTARNAWSEHPPQLGPGPDQPDRQAPH
jgi:hypothetical protein